MKITKLILVCCLFALNCLGQDKKKMKQLIDENMKFAAEQYKVLMKNVPADSMPRSYDPGKKQIDQ